MKVLKYHLTKDDIFIFFEIAIEVKNISGSKKADNNEVENISGSKKADNNEVENISGSKKADNK